MLHVSELKYSEACSFSSMRSWPISIPEDFHDVVRKLSGSLEGRLPPRPRSSSSLAQLVHDLVSEPRDVLVRVSVARDRARPVHTG
eukprot:CAMPEP_0172612710 /NCGR_PEP_ID=MMETSP1068-20121228/36253_1 /TAXON_ID=35684 /ORGANISM="Pseudopedinella elastica, Strain CCMP716" /LENGTH=85 /DNA_ID=CAMNT_0013416951 /DNA_START=230 /DNA_END=487 /DNA_ORIENTATION=+